MKQCECDVIAVIHHLLVKFAGSGLHWNREKETQRVCFVKEAQRRIPPQPGLIGVIRKM